MEANKSENLIWHYSRYKYLSLIQDSGQLIPKSEAEMYRREISADEEYNRAMAYCKNLSQTPFIWFSANQNLELLCAQLNGGLRDGRLNWKQKADLHKAIRFGINADDERLLDWEQTCIAGGMNREERRTRTKLSKQAKKFGSDVYGWYTSLKPIPLTDLHLQVWYRGIWLDYDL